MNLILKNGKIYTMDRDRSIKSSLCIKGNKIYKVGNDDELSDLINDNTKVIDLQGKTVVPGFNDSHMHLVNYGYTKTQVDLIDVKSIEDIRNRISKFIENKELGKDSWVMGRGWNQDYFLEEKVFPNRYDLDKISRTHPILITRVCGHVAVVNSKALELLGINKDTPQFEGGVFDIDEKGEPLGIFREKALAEIYNYIPSPNIREIKEMILAAVEDLNNVGITSVGSDDFEALPGKDYESIIKAYMELKEEGRLNIRVYEQYLIPDINRLDEFYRKGYKTGLGDEYFKIGALKILIDGSLGARTAALNKPYSDDDTTLGITTITQEELDKIVGFAHENGNQVAIHGIGDRAMYMAFESMEKALNKNKKKDHRHGIVHCQITDEYLLNKFKELDALAYIQPIFLDYDWKIVEDRVGKNRGKTSYNWKAMVERGIHIACGSDAPVENFNVMKGIYEAVTRMDLEGNPKEGWLPEQALTVDEALYGYTIGGAYGSFEENIKGSIEEGKLADMVILSHDIFEIDPVELKNVRVEAVIFDGEIKEIIG